MTREIELTKGEKAIVDDDDYELVSKFKWFTLITGKWKYAFRVERNKGIFMHRRIMGVCDKKGIFIDHIDHDGLNNSKCNLRVCTESENNRNRLKSIRSKTKYKGVRKSGKKWIAQVNYNKKAYYLGVFETPELAANAYNQKAIELHKDFACLNILTN